MSRDDLRAAAEKEVARWEQAITDELMRLFDRQQAVVLARLQGTKARKHTRHWEPAGTRVLEVKQVIDPARWVLDAAGSLAPVIRRLFAAVYKRVASQLDPAAPVEPQAADAVAQAVQARLDRVAEGVETSTKEVEAFIAAEEDAGTPMPQIVAGVQQLYSQRAPSWAARIATASAVGSINQAGLFAAADNHSSAKQWISSRDSKVRDTHEAADGQVRLLDERFKLGGIPSHPQRSELLFPGDPGPTVPADEVINCRCTLAFSPPRKTATKSEFDPAALVVDELGDFLEVKDRVRTAAGSQHYGLPIGALIVPNAPTFSAPHVPPAAAPSRGSGGGRPPRLATIAGSRVADYSDDPAVRALVAKYSTPGAVPDPAKTRVLALRDKRDRVGAYVVWQSEDGDQPKGTVLAVSVHPSLKGQRIGDQMVAEAAKLDPSVKVTTRPTTATPAAPAAVAAPSTRSTPVGLPAIASRAQAGDRPGSSGDFDADAARIELLQRAYLRDRADTQSLFSRNGRWTRDRERQQQAIIDHFLSQSGVKSDGRLLVLAGLPGAGKTTTINSPAGQAALGIDLSEYVTVNADEVKEQMLATGMVPNYPGLSDEESATLFHAESFEIAHSLMRQAAKRHLNFAYDTSLKSTGQMGFATDAARRSGHRYETTVLLVDVPPVVAMQRAKARYQAGDRYMPLGLIDKMKARRRGFSSLPSENFDAVKGSADRWFVFDNTGAAPVLAGQGGRRSRPSSAGGSRAVSV